MFNNALLKIKWCTRLHAGFIFQYVVIQGQYLCYLNYLHVLPMCDSNQPIGVIVRVTGWLSLYASPVMDWQPPNSPPPFRQPNEDNKMCTRMHDYADKDAHMHIFIQIPWLETCCGLIQAGCRYMFKHSWGQEVIFFSFCCAERC